VSAEEPLSPNDANLAHLANRQAPDLFLTELVQRAEVLGAGLGVALLVNGMVIMGGIASAMAMAEDIDAEWLGAVDRAGRPEGTSDEDWEAMRESVGKRQAESVQGQLDGLVKLEEDVQPHKTPDGIDALSVPAELGRRVIHANTYKHLTLRNAHIFAPGVQGVTAVGVIRVALDQIGGWWILRTDEDGKNHTTLWATDNPGVTFGDPPRPTP
jgi:hypothetical protein